MQKVLGVDVVCNKCLVQKAAGIEMCLVSTQLECKALQGSSWGTKPYFTLYIHRGVKLNLHGRL